jgi:hypothetical protein
MTEKWDGGKQYITSLKYAQICAAYLLSRGF